MRLEECIKAKAVTGNEATAVTHIRQDRSMLAHLCDLEIIFVCVQTQLWDGLAFVLYHLSHTVASSNVDILCNLMSSTGEPSGLAMRAKPAPSDT